MSPLLHLLLTSCCYLFCSAFKTELNFSDRTDTVESCFDDGDCVTSGRCINKTGSVSGGSVCMCSRSCEGVVPFKCEKTKHCGEKNFCDPVRGKCFCHATKRESCALKNLRIVDFGVSRNDPFIGESMEFQCCVNLEPKSVRLRFVHNVSAGSMSPSQVPDVGQCWTLVLRSVDFRDSGLYTCQASSSVDNNPVSVNSSLAVQVRAPVTLKLNVTAVNSTTLLATWSFSAVPHLGVILRAETVDHRLTFERRNLIDESTMFISNLKPATRYTITAETIPFKDNRTTSSRVNIVTREDLPGLPQVIDPVNRSSSSRCSIAWKAPKQPNGKILHYEVQIWGVLRRRPDDGSLASNHVPESVTPNCANLHKVPVEYDWNVCEFERLQANRDYAFSVAAVNGAGRSAAAVVEAACRTDFAPPADVPSPLVGVGAGSRAPSQLSTLVVNFTTLPDELNGPITCYYLAIVPHSESARRWKTPHSIEIETYQRAFEINLEKNGHPQYAYIAESYTKLPKATVIGDDREPTDVGRCSAYYMSRYVAQDPPLVAGSWYSGFLVVRVDPDPSLYQQQASLPATSDKLVVKKSVDGWSQPRYGYSDYFRSVYLGDLDAKTVVFGANGTEHVATSFGEESSLSIAILFPLILPLILAAVVFFLWKKYKHLYNGRLYCLDKHFVARSADSGQELHNLPRNFPAVPVEQLVDKYIEKHKNSDFLLAVEFEALPHYSFETAASDRPENAAKNRYNDIKAFDATRVVLNTINNDPHSDYINANYVNAYKGSGRVFIAAQGPLQETVNDFWRMIFEKDIDIVIMVTNLQERFRTMCVKYWPDQGTLNYGELQVTACGSTTYADYVVRKFEIDKIDISVDSERSDQGLLINGNEKITTPTHAVTQYHYTSWNDYRAPDGTVGLLKFLNLLRRQDSYENGSSPILVHCSAGVGRTGTLIALDVLMDQIHVERRADVFDVVSDMRRQRNFMVQSLEQYVFVYKALAEFQLFGETDVEADKIDARMSYLRSVDSDGQTELAKEYDKLSRTMEDTRSYEIAVSRNNHSKNRFIDYLPFDRNRIILQPVLGQVDASYVNASLIKGYHHAYIATQDPMPDTIWDFWRMVIEYNVTCIVCLSHEHRMSPLEKYWPQKLGRNGTFGENPAISVQFHAEFSHASCQIRKLHLTSPKINGEIREVFQFFYSDWSTSTTSSSLPSSTSLFLDMMGRVLQRRDSSCVPGPVLVHCSNGSTRCGLYIAVSLILERLRTEQKIDVFQTVKSLQAQRMGTVDSLEHYEFAYKAALDYLQSFQ